MRISSGKIEYRVLQKTKWRGREAYLVQGSLVQGGEQAFSFTEFVDAERRVLLEGSTAQASVILVSAPFFTQK